MTRRTPAAWPALWIGFALIAAIGLAYADLPHHAFIPFDDNAWLIESTFLRHGFDATRLDWLTGAPDGSWIPLTWASLLLDVEWGGLEPRRILVTNLLLHMLATLLLLHFLISTTGAPWRSGFVAAVFALHPLHVESVAWASQRKDVLCAVMWMATLLAHVRYARAPSVLRMGVVALSLVGALLAKPVAVTLPFVLLLVDAWPLGRLGPLRARRDVWARLRVLTLEKSTLFALVAVLAILTFQMQQATGAMQRGAQLPLGLRLENALASYGAYLWRAVWPVDLSIFYPYPVAGIPAWRWLGSGLALATLSTLALWRARAQPAQLVGWLWFVGTLVPMIGVVQVGMQARADRYAYLPLIGLAIAVCFGLPAAALATRGRRRAAAAMGVVVVALLAAQTSRQVQHWANGETLFRHARRVVGDDPTVRRALGVALLEQGQRDRAVHHLSWSFGVPPATPDVERQLVSRIANGAERYFAQRAVARAALEYALLEGLDPEEVAWPLRMAEVRLEQGRLADAVRSLERALELGAGAAELELRLAQLYRLAGRDPDAAERYRAPRRARPGEHRAAHALAVLLATTEDAELRDRDEALRIARTLATEPTGVDDWTTLARLQVAAGDRAAAALSAERALSLAVEAGAPGAAIDRVRRQLASYRDPADAP